MQQSTNTIQNNTVDGDVNVETVTFNDARTFSTDLDKTSKHRPEQLPLNRLFGVAKPLFVYGGV